MHKISITPSSFGSSSKQALDILNSNFIIASTNKEGRRLTKSETINILNGCDGVIAGLEIYDNEVFENCPKLRVISRVGIGTDNIDFDAAKKYNVQILNTPEEPAYAVAEMTLSMMLFFSKNINFFNENTHNKVWKKKINKSLKNSNILIIGYGRIGQYLDTFLRPFGANIMISDPLFKDLPNYIDLNDGIKKADFISLNANTEKTIIDKDQFKLLKKGVIILNPSRQVLINTNLVIDYINKDIISSIWFDAFTKEPYEGSMIGIKNIYLSPHISTYTDICRKNMEMKAVTNLMNYFENE